VHLLQPSRVRSDCIARGLAGDGAARTSTEKRVTEQVESAIVRISAGGVTAGVGFLIDPSRVLTCAHVVEAALGIGAAERPPADAAVQVEFVLLESGPALPASLEHFDAADATGGLDVAVLRLEAPAPTGAAPARLAWEDGLWGHGLAAFGFPAGYDEGTWVSGVFRGRQASGWVQVEGGKQTGYRLERGYSGGPAWDLDLDAVAGMVVAADRHPTSKAGWVIPTALLKKACPDLPVERPLAGGNRDTFVDRLTAADSLTIVGFTHERLIDYLEEAHAHRGQHAVGPWDQVRVVFLDPSLLGSVDDDLEQDAPGQGTALRQHRSTEASRTLNSFFLRQPVARRWELRLYPYQLPFIGALFTLPGGGTLAEVATLQPPRPVSRYLYLDLPPRSVAHYQTVFEHVWSRSRPITEEVVVFGEPADDEGFLCAGFVPRRRVLTGATTDWRWLAAVIVLLWEQGRDGPLPLLNVNTRSNSTREIGRISHLSGYMNRRDCAPDDADVDLPLVMDRRMVVRAAQRELLEELGIEIAADRLAFEGEIRFHYADKENLYFYVMSAEVERGARLRFSRPAQVRPWTLERLLAVRRHQVLSTLLEVVAAPGLSPRQLQLAAEVLADHLEIHREPELADRVRSDVGAGRRDRLARELQTMMSESEVVVVVDGETQAVSGLGGLQYREFFASLLPPYAAIGVPGAKDYLDWLRGDERAGPAYDRLASFYADEAAVRQLGVDV